MFKKLRIKFIAITMAMVAIVMALAFTVVCVVEYQRSLSIVETALDSAAQTAIRDHGISKAMKEQRASDPAPDGSMQPPERRADDTANTPVRKPSYKPSGESPNNAADENAETVPIEAAGEDATQAIEAGEPPSEIEPEDQVPPETEGSSETNPDIVQEGDSQDPVPPAIGRRGSEPRASSSLIPVATYRISETGTSSSVPQVTSASIEKDLLSEALEETKSHEDGYGTLTDLGLHYYKTTAGDSSYLVFTDTSYTDGWKSLALILAGAGAGTLVVFLVISIFYSRWALRPVREAWDSQRQFVADASHDLKTPLTVILANASILLKHPERTIASESQWVESTQKEAENMQGLVNEMLELAQIESGQQASLVRDPIDLSDLVDGETLLFDSVALERNCAFTCQIEQGITILGDEKQVHKMVSTLIENAFKYVDDSGEISIVARKVGKNATVAIRNSGSTISPEDLPHIFDRFYRTDKARTSDAGGFGLGLAIAHEVAVQHGGDIACESDDANGTTFTITLPMVQS